MKMGYKKTILSCVLALLMTFGHGKAAWAISTTANALQVVIASLAISKVSDLDFGSAAQGDAAKVVPAGTAEATDNASFAISGAPSTAYTITLPSDGVVVMQTAGGGLNKDIAVNTFTSFPSSTGMLDGSGNQLLLVGATRASLGASQVTGSYTGSFTVSVVY
jgi:hypothetical protein